MRQCIIKKKINLVVTQTLPIFVLQNEKTMLTTTEQKEMYRGYEIITKPNGPGHISTVCINGVFKAGTVTDLIEGGKTSVEKAKVKIDALIAGTYKPIPGKK